MAAEINQTPKTITILSAYNRGQWLANELISKNYKVNYVELSEKLGGLTPEAWESPFGVFLTKKISYSQNIWLSEGTQLQEVPHGFTILADKGPLEFQGPMLKKSLERYSVDLDQVDYIKASVQMNDEPFFKFKSHFMNKEFSKTWCLQFAHNAASTVFYENASSFLNYNRPLPLYDNWITRRYSRRGALDSLRMSHDKGVKVVVPKSFKGIKADQKRLEQLKFEGESKDIDISSQVYLNFLSQEELNFVSPVLHQSLYGENIAKSDWFWTKYRVVMSHDEITEVLPNAFCFIGDRFLSWSHDNFLIFQKTPATSQSKNLEYVVWLRIPSHYRFQHNKLEEISKLVQRNIESKFVNIKIESVELPLECLATEFQVEVPHLPVFNPKIIKSLKSGKFVSKFKNVFHMGPEMWLRLDTSYLLEMQAIALKNIMGTEDQQGIKRRRGRDSEIYS